MSGRVKAGLIVGLVGMVVNLVASFVLGVCGPVVTLVAGGVAGFVAARSEGPGPRVRSAQAGAIAGLLAGALMIISQTIAAVGVLIYFQVTGTPSLMGTIPANPSLAQQVGILAGGLATGGCFGLIGMVLAAMAGAAAGYLGGPGEMA